MRLNLKNLKKHKWLLIAAAFALGIFVVLLIRFATYHVEKGVHYHANFALYINGQREQFKEPFYYEEVTSCNSHEEMTPHERTHMHEQVNSVVHVHDHAVTWGDFFQNIGWVVDMNLIETPQSKIYLADAQNKVTFILNGQKVENPINQVIGDEDKLLINYGASSEQELQDRYKTVPATAHKYDVSKDPASCSGGVHPTTFSDRLKHLF